MPTGAWIALAVALTLVPASFAYRGEARRMSTALREVARRRGGTVVSGRLGAMPRLRLETAGRRYEIGTHGGSIDSAGAASCSFAETVLPHSPGFMFVLTPRSVQSRLDATILGGSIPIPDAGLSGYEVRGSHELDVREALAPVLAGLLAPPAGHRVSARLARTKRFAHKAWSEPVVLDVAVEPMSTDPGVLEWLLEQAQALDRSIARLRGRTISA
jgi:hypothetical protein